MELLKAREVEEAIPALKKGTLYRMAKAGVVRSYHVGEKEKGVRFMIDEVLHDLRKVK